MTRARDPRRLRRRDRLHLQRARVAGRRRPGRRAGRALGAHCGRTSSCQRVAMAIACAIAIPLGLWLGHIGKGEFLAITLERRPRRAEPRADRVLRRLHRRRASANVTLALVLLAIPPILTNAYVGVRQVDRDTVDAARGMGMTGAADRPPGRAAARAAADLRRHPDLGRQRDRHRHDRAARRRAHARRSRSSTRTSTATTGRLGGAHRRRRCSRSSAELVLGAVQRAVTPQGLKLEGGGTRSAPLRNGTAQQEEGSHLMRTHRWLMLARAAGRRTRAWPAAATTTTTAATTGPRRTAEDTASIADPDEPDNELVDEGHDRLEELHRAVHPRRDLRAGARGGRVQRHDGAQPRRREDRAEGARGRRDRRLPGVHRARRCSSFFGVTADKLPKRPQAGLRGGARRASPRRT